MASLSNHQSNNFVKLLALGDSKSGKTGSLVSLVKAGYKLRILDFDNLLDVLKYYVMKECPENIDNVEFRSLRDSYKGSDTGTIISGTPKAWTTSLKMLNNWKYTEDGAEVDLGVPGDWGPDCILVIDSLSRWCDAAYNFHEMMTPKGKNSGEADGRAVYGNAQRDIEKQLATLTSDSFATNVIVICHGMYMDLNDGSKKIFPQGMGQKLSPKIPTYFPNYLRYKNSAGTRTITTVSDPMIDLATTRPFAMEKSYPISTGLADIFATLKDQPKQEATAPQPKVPPKFNLKRA